jgi:hypothetical protein
MRNSKNGLQHFLETSMRTKRRQWIGGTMKRLIRLLALAMIISPLAAHANDFPTTDRVEYVLECMKNNAGKQEYLYKCSCVIDRIAEKIKYKDYVEMSTSQRYQSLGGERGAVFRDPQDVKKAAKTYKSIEDAAQRSCFSVQ